MRRNDNNRRPNDGARERVTVVPDLFKEYYGPLVDDPEAFYKTVTTPLPKALRVNRLKADPEYIKKRYAGYGIPLRDCPWYSDALVPENPTDDPSPTLEHFLGQVYVQELTSMLPPLVLREEILNARATLDCCAAPGSKSTQIASIMQNQGTLIANDIDYNRIRALKHNLSKAGAQNIILTNVDLAEFPNEQKFKVIFLDAPCSSDGTIRKVNKMLPRWSAQKAIKYSAQQRHLILKAYSLLAPKGVMLYSTCSFSPEENECVVSHLLANSDAEIEPFNIENFHLADGITKWNSELDPRVVNTRRVWGHHNDTGGFYLAKIRKPGNGGA